MNIKRFSSTKEIPAYSFEDIIQVENNVAKHNIIHKDSYSIELQDIASTVVVYNSKDLLKEISKLGEKYLYTQNLKITFKPKYNNSNNIEENTVPFGLVESQPFINNFHEAQNEILNSIVNWCNEYGSPYKPKDLDYSDRPVYVLQQNSIECFVSKCCIIYCINSINQLILKVDELLLDDECENANREISKLKNLLQKGFNLIDDYRSLHLDSNIEYSNSQEYLDKIQQIKSQFAQYTNLWYDVFTDNISSFLYYDTVKEEYRNISVSNDITNLAWSELLSQLVTNHSSRVIRKCLYCGCNFYPDDMNKTGPKLKYCPKHRKPSSKERDNKKRESKKKLKKILKTNNMSEDMKQEIEELLKCSDRRFPIKKYKKIVAKFSSL